MVGAYPDGVCIKARRTVVSLSCLMGNVYGVRVSKMYEGYLESRLHFDIKKKL